MYRETNKRSIVKGISWRVIATTTTIIIVYVFFDRLDLAIAAGMIETVLKVGLYWLHERVWFKIRWGKKKIEPFNLWFTGLPDLIPDIGYSREDRNRHMHRIGFLIQKLQKNAISTVATFVSPYRESRKAIREMVTNNIVVYIKADIETCKTRDYKGVYQKAMEGKLQNFSGVNDVYEAPEHAEITVDTDKMSADEAAEMIVKYVKKNYVK